MLKALLLIFILVFIGYDVASRTGNPMLGMGAVVVAGLVALAYAYWRSRCPKCGRSWALKWTGRTASQGHGLFKRGYAEWKCKYCGHSVDRARSVG